jgi:hypothetical protein
MRVGLLLDTAIAQNFRQRKSFPESFGIEEEHRSL